MTGAYRAILLSTYRVAFLSISILMIYIEYSYGVYIPLLQILTVPMAVLYILRLSVDYPAFILSYSYQIYFSVGLLISIILISSGSYMMEIGEYGTANSAFWVCLLFFISGMEAALRGYRHGFPLQNFCRNLPNLSLLQTRIALYLLPASMILIAVSILILFKGPIILGVDRVSFWQRIVPDSISIFPSIFGQSFILIPILFYGGYGSADRRSSRVSAFFCLAYLILTVVLLGEKFSTFIVYLTMWAAVAAGYGIKVRVNVKTTIIALAISLALFYLITYSYEASGFGRDFIFSRIALQGELLWSVMNEADIFGFGNRDWSCYLGCDGYASGAKYISAIYMIHGLFLSYEQSGSGLTGYMPALPILVFGFPIAFVFHVIISYFSGYAQIMMVSAVRSRNIIVSIIMFKIYFGITIFWYAANVYPLRGVFVTSVALLTIWILWSSVLRKIRA